MFDISKFTSVAAQALSDNAEMHWLYQTTDSAATIQKIDDNHFNNYFGSVYSLVSEGNIITVRHMSTPDDTAATKSMTSTVIDEVDYVVLYKGQNRNDRGGIEDLVYVLPLEKGQRVLVRKFDDATTFTNVNVSFQSPVYVRKFGIASASKFTENATLVLTLKQTDHDGTQLGTVSMTKAQADTRNYFAETVLPASNSCIEATFNVEGDAHGGNVPFVMYLVAESDELAHTEKVLLTTEVADANTGATKTFHSPVAGKLVKLEVAATANAGAGGCTYTPTIDGNAVTNGVATIAENTKVGVAIPTANNTVPAGATIVVTYTALGAAGASAILLTIER